MRLAETNDMKSYRTAHNANRALIFFSTLLCLLACARIAPAQDSRRLERRTGDNRPFVPGRILVKFHDGVTADRISNILSIQGVNDAGEIPGIGVHILLLPPGAIESVYVQAFQQQPEVEFTQLDQIVAPLSTNPGGARTFQQQPEAQFAQLGQVVAYTSVIPNDPSYYLQWNLPRSRPRTLGR